MLSGEIRYKLCKSKSGQRNEELSSKPTFEGSMLTTYDHDEDEQCY